MSKIENIKEFNNILETFLGQLVPLVGTTYHHYFKKLIKINATMPIQEFSKNVIPYKNQIMMEDESYFTDTSNHSDEINGDSNTLNEILRLKDIYEKLDLSSRKEVWSYFQALTILSEEYLKFTR